MRPVVLAVCLQRLVDEPPKTGQDQTDRAGRGAGQNSWLRNQKGDFAGVSSKRCELVTYNIFHESPSKADFSTFGQLFVLHPAGSSRVSNSVSRATRGGSRSRRFD